MIQRTKRFACKQTANFGGEPASGFLCVQFDHGGLVMFTYNC